MAGTARDRAAGAGTAKITFKTTQRQEIKKFVVGGGTLLRDAAGGSPAFADSIEKELLAIFPVEAPQVSMPIPMTDPLYARSARRSTRPAINNNMNGATVRSFFATIATQPRLIN